VKRYIDKVAHNIHTLPLDTPMPFSEAKVKDISTDTLRKILHRLHDKGEISIVDLQGKVIQIFNTNDVENSFRISTKEFNSGIYLVKYKSNSGTQSVEKLIISK